MLDRLDPIPDEVPAQESHREFLQHLLQDKRFDEELTRIADQILYDNRRLYLLEVEDFKHEVLLEIFRRTVPINDQEHLINLFYQIARHVLINTVRKAKSLKRGEGIEPMSLDEERGVVAQSENFPQFVDIPLDTRLTLEFALGEIREKHPRAAEVINLQYHYGCTLSEVAQILKVSVMTVKRDKVLAHEILQRMLGGE